MGFDLNYVSAVNPTFSMKHLHIKKIAYKILNFKRQTLYSFHYPASSGMIF